MESDPSPISTWVFPLGLLTGLREYEILLKKDLEIDCPPGKDYISKGRRLTLIRSTLSSLLIYFLSLFRMPTIVWSRPEKIQRDFLWDGGNLERKPHLVDWNTVCQEKRRGGLGVRGLSMMNQALLCKWCWRFANEGDSLWRLVISTKFGEEVGGWNTRDIRGGYGTGLWKDIRKE